MSVMINDEALCKVWTAISLELVRSKKLHPNYPADHLRRTGITMEEGLEAMSEIVSHVTEMASSLMRLQQAGLQVARVGNDEAPATLADLRKELIHLATMAVKQLEAMEQEGTW